MECLITVLRRRKYTREKHRKFRINRKYKVKRVGKKFQIYHSLTKVEVSCQDERIGPNLSSSSETTKILYEIKETVVFKTVADWELRE